MTLRHGLAAGLGIGIVAVLLVGFAALLTQQQLQAALGAADASWRPLVGRAQTIIIVATGLGAAALGGLGWFLHRTLLQPLDRLTDAVRTLDPAAHEATDLTIDRPDEVGALAQAIRTMTTTIHQRTVSRTYLNNILDSMAEMLFVVDPEGHIRRSNRAAQHQLGYAPRELRQHPMQMLLADGPLFTEAERAILHRRGFLDHAERTMRTRAGTLLPVLFSRARISGAADGAAEIVCVAQDITDRKAAEDQIKAQLEEKEVLLREIHHRVKNNLQIISSLLHLQSKQVDQAEARALFADSQSRIRSMALIHERLYQSDDLARVDFAAYLERLTDHLFRSYGVRADRIERTLLTDEAALGVDRAIPCGLIVNELVTNALKHAFPDGRSGTITVRYREHDADAQLEVADDGVGPPRDLDHQAPDTLGLRLVRGLVRQLDGTLAIDADDGLCVTITFPLSPA